MRYVLTICLLVLGSLPAVACQEFSEGPVGAVACVMPNSAAASVLPKIAISNPGSTFELFIRTDDDAVTAYYVEVDLREASGVLSLRTQDVKRSQVFEYSPMMMPIGTAKVVRIRVTARKDTAAANLFEPSLD